MKPKTGCVNVLLGLSYRTPQEGGNGMIIKRRKQKEYREKTAPVPLRTPHESYIKLPETELKAPRW
jgi:hypothetical protein